MMDHTSAEKANLTLIKTYFASLKNGDMETFASLFDKEVVWHQPGNHPFSGEKHGFEEIGQMVGGMMSQTAGTFVVSQDGDLMANGDLVSAPVSFSGSKGSASISMQGSDLFLIKNNKIVEVWLFSQNQTKEDAFWSA
ncbi:nuclear transport factor 2 family protein [Enterovibrio calviensis]|uniref:nuclear transport factor 2 family protein n=1 Tax=Enterovibrio calviensis TaxID=91359 RepID=UPI0037352980